MAVVVDQAEGKAIALVTLHDLLRAEVAIAKEELNSGHNSEHFC